MQQLSSAARQPGLLRSGPLRDDVGMAATAAPACLAAPLLLALAAAAQTAGADEAGLSGPNVIVFRHEPLPFVSSTRFVRQGTRIDGGCRYDRGVMSLAPGELPPEHSLVRIVRAHDPVACRELVEQGIVPKAGLPTFSNDGMATNGGSGTLQMTGPGTVSTTIAPR